ncbi:ABC transporter ATP-binding protein [Streptomyces sp. OM5714]|uniref:ABC transporter ATP-binding protein n=1 Tax=Streptomyces sp. OM5714 TaxID=2602736 RepID=UPI0013D9AB84|nr:ABC transporter ATP-binding protein [Streptomyces sp. OM5714]KAF2775130.1 branched amino acid transport system ATP-binding protein [Streptomyces sp. OM5714]
MTAVVDVAGATVRYGGVTAVDDFTLSHSGGGVIGLIGPNGAGKTTLLNALSGVVPLTSGTVRVNGHDLTGAGPVRTARAGVTRTFQNLQVFGSLTVLQNVMLPRTGRSMRRSLGHVLGLPAPRRGIAAHRRAALGLLERVGMSPYAHRAAGSLAYGLQRRVEIARALAGDPAVLLLDEPLAGLARAESTGLTRLFAEIAAEGVTVLLVEHDVAAVFAVSDRVLVLDRGRLLADGTPEHVAADPAVRTAYLGDEL